LTDLSAQEAVRHRLPEIATAEVKYRRAETLEGIANESDMFILDAFGAISIGETAIPETLERVKSVKAVSKSVLVVSNTAGFPENYISC